MKTTKLNIFFFTFAFSLFTFSLSFAQEEKPEVDEKTDVRKPNSIESIGEKIEFKNETTNSILTITDEGNGSSSILIPPAASTPNSIGSKLYNKNGDLFFDSYQLNAPTSGNSFWLANQFNTSMIYYNLGNVGIGTTIANSNLTVGGNGDSKAAIYGKTVATNGYGIYGLALSSTTTQVTNYGGYFNANGENGRGVYGLGNGLNGTGVYGQTYFGYGVYGKANTSNPSGITHYGGYFEANGELARAVYGEAIATGNSTSYGGYFTSASEQGIAVFGEGISNSNNAINYGGYFIANGLQGKGVYGKSTGIYGIGIDGISNGDLGRGVSGLASKSYNGINYGGYFKANGVSGRGVYGEANGTTGYGVHGKSSGLNGIGVFGESIKSGSAQRKYGGYFIARGDTAVGIYGEGSASDVGYGVHGKGIGNNSIGVYGESVGLSNIAIYGKSPTGGQAGYFDGNVYVTGHLTVDGLFLNPSDKRLKKNITPLTNVLSSLSQINGFSYNWKIEDFPERNFKNNKLQVGVIAQDLEKVFPNFVFTDKDGYKSVDYIKLSVVTMQAVKELNSDVRGENQDLREKIKELEKQNLVVSSKNEELENRLSKIESILDGKRFTSASK